MKKWLGIIGLVSVLGMAPLAGCISTPDGPGVEFIEEFNEQEFFKFQTYLRLSVKIATNRLLTDGDVTMEEINMIADIVDQATNTPIFESTTSLIGPLLEDAGLIEDEIALMVLIVEQELISRGALDWLDPITGAAGLSPRTRELLTTIVSTLRASEPITFEEEAEMSAAMRQAEAEVQFIDLSSN